MTRLLGLLGLLDGLRSLLRFRCLLCGLGSLHLGSDNHKIQWDSSRRRTTDLTHLLVLFSISRDPEIEQLVIRLRGLDNRSLAPWHCRNGESVGDRHLVGVWNLHRPVRRVAEGCKVHSRKLHWHRAGMLPLVHIRDSQAHAVVRRTYPRRQQEAGAW